MYRGIARPKLKVHLEEGVARVSRYAMEGNPLHNEVQGSSFTLRKILKNGCKMEFWWCLEAKHLNLHKRIVMVS